MRSVMWKLELISCETFADRSLLIPHVQSTCLNRDIWKFESSLKDESRAKSADSSKAYRKARVFNNCTSRLETLFCAPCKIKLCGKMEQSMCTCINPVGFLQREVNFFNIEQ